MTWDRKPQFSAASPELRALVQQARNELEVDRAFRNAALRCIREDVPGFLKRTATKFWYYWWFTPTYGAEYSGWISGLAQNLYKLVYGALLALICAGAWRGLFRPVNQLQRPITLFILALPLGLAAIHFVHYVETRHRLLAMPVMLLVAGWGMEWLGSHRLLKPASGCPETAEGTGMGGP